MKYRLLLCTLVFISNLTAQSICENFDSVSVPTQNIQHAFNIYGNGQNGFLRNWRVVSGTPSIQPSGQLAGVNAFSGNQYALQGVCDIAGGWNEGLSLQYDFVQGQDYQVTLAIRNKGIGATPTPIDIQFVLLDNPIPFTYQFSTGCTPTPSIPAGAVITHTINGFDQDAWQLVQFNITGLTADYQQLWIRAAFSPNAPLTTTLLLMDSFCVAPVNNAVCYSFDEQAIPSNESQHTFNTYGNGQTGFLQDWNVVSGTPSINSSGSLNGVPAFEGNQFASTAVCDISGNWNESVSLTHAFLPGRSYQVSMAIRNRGISGTPTPIDLDFVLLKDKIPFTYQFSTGCTPLPATPVDAETVHSISSFNQDSWQVIYFDFNVTTDTFSHLWFRNKFSSGAPLVTTLFLFDSVCVQEISNPTQVTEKEETPSVTVFPNPTSGDITIHSAMAQGLYEIRDAVGRLIKWGNIPASSFSLSLSDVGRGLYFITLADGKQVWNQKVVRR